MRKGGVVAIIIIAVLIIAAVVGFIVYNNSQTSASTGSGYQQQTSAGLQFEEDQSNIVREAIRGVELPGWEEITIDAGKTDVYVDFFNPEGNEGRYYLTFELRLSDTGETIYQSGLVKPGDHIKKITLSRALSKGTYDAVLHIQPYDAETQVATNNADVKLKLIAA